MRAKLAANPLPVVLFTVFVDLLGLGILIPIIPQLLANPKSGYYLFGKNVPISHGYIVLGFLVAIFPLMQFFATPILGQLSDKFGRKKILAISLAGTSISYILFAIGIMTKNIPLLFAARGFDGITGGNIAVAQAAVADVTPPEKRARNFGLIGAAFGFGFVVGPYLGGKLSDPAVVSWFNATTPFFFAAILAALNVTFVLTLFPETLQNLSHHIQIKWTKSIHNIIHAATYSELKSLFAVNFLFQGGFTFFTTFFGVFLIKRFGFTQGNIGDFFAYVGLWIIFTQAVITRALSKKFTEYQRLRVTFFGMALVILCFFLPKIWWQLLLVSPFMAMFNGLSQANTTALVSRSVDGQVQGEILGINASVMALGQTIPPILSGYIAADLFAEAPIFVASIVIFLAGLTFLLFYKPIHFQKPAHIEE